MKRQLWVIFLVAALFGGCTGNIGNKEKEISNIDIPVYAMSVTDLEANEKLNPYSLSISEDGFAYCIQEEWVDDKTDEISEKYYLYFQPYNESEVTIPFGVIENGYLRDISVSKSKKCVLTVGDEAQILIFDESNNLKSKIIIDERFNRVDTFPQICMFEDLGFSIAVEDEIFLLDNSGKIIKSMKFRGNVNKMLKTSNGRFYAVIEDNKSGKASLEVELIDFEKGKSVAKNRTPDGSASVCLFNENTLVSFSNRYIYLFDLSGNEETIVDLEKQGILFSQIVNIYGTKEDLNVVSVDKNGETGSLFVVNLRKNEQGDSIILQKDKYFSDGRPYVRVAVPEDYYLNIEYYAKKYNQKCSDGYIEIERFSGSLEDYLGHGNRPDIVLFNNHTEVTDYAQKGALSKLEPLFENNSNYNISDLIIAARNLLSFDNNLFAISGRFELLVRPSAGNEFGLDGYLDAVDYLKWYDEFLDSLDVEWKGEIENILYANITNFIDEKEGSANFTSSEFKKLIETYKTVYNKHTGRRTRESSTKIGSVNSELILGPLFLNQLDGTFIWTLPEGKMVGIPQIDGESSVFIEMYYPMAIMETSEIKETAFDFIMYYNTRETYYFRDEKNFGDSINANAYFYAFNSLLTTRLYENEGPYLVTRKESGALDELEYYYITDAIKANFDELLEKAIPTTKAQDDIYVMLMEEMDGYFKDKVSLDDACRVLQSRATIYLSERK